MRLLHTDKLTIEYFEGADIPWYSILSHRWGSEEVSYQGYRDRTSTQKSGYTKIINLCRLAKSRGIEWTWIDTCCIDKTSSAELTESINSMWAYYRDAIECYVYLADVPAWVQLSRGSSTGNSSGNFSHQAFAAFQNSEWFTRGWALQELIAPTNVLFCTSAWNVLASKVDLAEALSSITGIPTLYLTRPNRAREASVAMRMSWASKRQTTRIEDIAYCLLGLFDINMTMLYGEGMKASMRLQRRIIKKYDDESIFAWADEKTSSGMLASDPKAFATSGDVVKLNVPPEQRLQFQLTNKGLELKIPRTVFTAEGRPVPLNEKQQLASSFERHRLAGSPSESQHRNIAGSVVERWLGPSNQEIPYTPLVSSIPNNLAWKRVQLACSSGNVTNAESEGVVTITLSRTEHGWVRIHCNRFDHWNKFHLKDDSSRSLYYVPQEGL